MSRQIPHWVSTVIVILFTVGILTVLSTAMRPPAGAMVGTTPVNFEGTTQDGKTFRLSDYKGKVVLVNFWATWCGPCRIEIPDLKKLQTTYADKGFTVIGISDDDKMETVVDFYNENAINYPTILMTKEIRTQFGGVPALPESFLLDKTGKIVWQQSGIDPSKSVEKTIAPEIEKALAQ